MQLQPRREVWELGLLPLPSACPQLDSLATLQQAHKRLLSRSVPSASGQRVVTPADVSDVFELTNIQLDAVCELLFALSVSNGTTADECAQTLGHEQIVLHELTLFLFAQLFSREIQRPDSVEVWPEAGPSPMSLGTELLSPTRAMAAGKAVSTGKQLLRQQLQQHLRNQLHALRGFGDYLRKNLRLIIEFCMDSPPWPGTPGTGPAAAPFAQAPSQQQQGDVRVTAQELDRVQFLMLPPKPKQTLPVSSLVPGLSGLPIGLPLDQVVAALKSSWHEDVLDSPRFAGFSPSAFSPSASIFSNALSGGGASSPSPKAQRALGIVGPSGQVDEGSISGVVKGTVVRGEADLTSGQLRITDCHDTVIYVLAPLQAVFISSCSDCTVVIGAAGRLVRLERCDKVSVMAAATRTVISGCHECTLHLGTLRQPLLLGDCRFIRLAPLNTRYERQIAHLRDAGVRLDLPNKWDSPLVLAGNARPRLGSNSGAPPESPRAGSTSMAASLAAASSGGGSNGSKQALPFSLLPPEELMPFVVPFQGGAGVLAGGPAPSHSTRWRQMGPGKGLPQYAFPLPPEYERAMLKKLAMANELRQRVSQAGLTKDKERELNDTIQAYFKEWLSSNNMLRQIYDLSNLEKDDSLTGEQQVQLQQPPQQQPRDRVTLSL